MKESKLKAFGRLLTIMDELREQCPWDKKQTIESLRLLTIEETYELADAIADNNLEELKGEIGDIMLHMVFYARIADEKGAFDIEDVLNFLCEKLIRRHPHIYGDIKVKDENEVKANWEKIKLQEGKKSILSGVPNSLPSMVKAYRIQEKAKQVGFEWENKDQVFEKVKEELSELETEVNAENQNHQKVEEEFGDLLFSLINYARFLNIDPEMALEKTNKKFKKRFQYIEEHASKDLNDMTLEEMDLLWNEAKSH
jgi:XTP/dITP diphosphohydrolase